MWFGAAYRQNKNDLTLNKSLEYGPPVGPVGFRVPLNQTDRSLSGWVWFCQGSFHGQNPESSGQRPNNLMSKPEFFGNPFKTAVQCTQNFAEKFYGRCIRGQPYETAFGARTPWPGFHPKP